uniref:Uncharacterized protein n=1 Tax=Zea mays TaxID=4577 RepID=A0A804PPG9_MAIZE
MLVWRPKKILEQCPENFGQDSAPGINGSSVPAASGDRYFRDLSLSGNNSQIFGISGDSFECRRFAFHGTYTVHKTPLRSAALEESVAVVLPYECGTSATFALQHSWCG